MSVIPALAHSRIWQASNTATTGGAITLSTAANSADPLLGHLFNFRDLYSNGAVNVPLCLFNASSGLIEYSLCTLTYGASVTLDVLGSRVIIYSSLGAAIPIPWAGTQNAICAHAPEAGLRTYNSGYEMSDSQALAFLLRLLATNTPAITGIGNLNGNIPAVGAGNKLASSIIPAHTDDSQISTLTGLVANRVMRYASSGVVTSASSSDTPSALTHVLICGSDGVPYGSGHFVPFAGVAAGTRYYLGTAGALTSTVPTIAGPLTPTTLLEIGVGFAAGLLYFDPKIPVCAPGGFGFEHTVYLDPTTGLLNYDGSDSP